MDIERFTDLVQQIDAAATVVQERVADLKAQRTELRKLLRPFLVNPYDPQTLCCRFCGVCVTGTGYHRPGCAVLHISVLLGEYET